MSGIFHISFCEDSDFCMEFESSMAPQPCTPYEGSYTVTPKLTEQELETEDRHCAENIHILSIPYYEVGNIHGTTAIIGGN